MRGGEPGLQPQSVLRARGGHRPVGGHHEAGLYIGDDGFTSVKRTRATGRASCGPHQQNTQGFSMVQLASNGRPAAERRHAGWAARRAGTRRTPTGHSRRHHLGTVSMLPDSGLSYMIVDTPERRQPAPGRAPTARGVQHLGQLPDQPGTRYSFCSRGQTTVCNTAFAVGDTSNPSMPYGVEVSKNNRRRPTQPRAHLLREPSTYLYDPINGFVGYRSPVPTAGSPRSSRCWHCRATSRCPMDSSSSFTTFLMSGLTL